MVALIKKPAKYLAAAAVLICVILGILFMYRYMVDVVKDTQQVAINELHDRDFQFIWDQLQQMIDIAEYQTTLVAETLETEIRNDFDLDQLKKDLDQQDPKTVNKLHSIIRNCITDVYFGDTVHSNRNSMIVLEGYDTILEDRFIDPSSRESEKELILSNPPKLSDYRATTFNPELFDSAMRKIRTHSDSPIALEPYNYIEEDHAIITEMNFDNLKNVFVNEGLEGLRNYQFLVPVYITESGDIFGQSDTANGVPQINHKFTVMMTFNLYDQIMHIRPNFTDRTHEDDTIDRYDTIINALHIVGIIISILIIVMVLYLVNLHNHAVDEIKEEE